MNITMIAGTFYLIFLFFGLGFRPTAFATVLIVILYVGLAGAGIPIQRAGCGAFLVLMAAMAGRASHLLNSLCFAFFAILVWNPQSLWNVGFQLSFLCVLSLILILPVFSHMGAWTLSLASSLAVLVGTFPVVLYYFNIFSPVSVLANIVAIPLCDAALFTALFALLCHGVPFLNIALVKISSWIVSASLVWIQYLSTWRWGYWFLERPSLGQIAAYYMCMAGILFLHKKFLHQRRLLMTGFVCLWIFFLAAFFTGSGGKNFELNMLASGRNQIVHAHFMNGDHWLLNAGRKFPSDQGEWLITPFLKSRGIQRLEGILLTDLSRRHTGGLLSVLRDFPVHHVLYPGGFSSGGADEFHKNLARLGRKVKAFHQGDEVLMGKEKVRLAVQSQKGAAFLLESGPWRILLVSRWDPGLFAGLLQGHESCGEIHAVFLPESKPEISREFLDWLDRIRPLLVVLPGLQPEIEECLVARHIPYLDLMRTGALNFRWNGPRLELASFLRGRLGVYTFS